MASTTPDDIFVTNEVQHSSLVNRGRKENTVNRNAASRRIAPASVVVAKPEDSDDERELQKAFNSQLKDKMQEQYGFYDDDDDNDDSDHEMAVKHEQRSESQDSEYTNDTDSENDVAYERYYGGNKATYSDEDEAGEVDEHAEEVEMVPLNPLVKAQKKKSLHDYSKDMTNVSYDLGQQSKNRTSWLFQIPVTAIGLRFRSLGCIPAHNVFRVMLYNFMHHRAIEWFIVLSIVGNCIFLSVKENGDEYYRHFFDHTYNPGAVPAGVTTVVSNGITSVVDSSGVTTPILNFTEFTSTQYVSGPRLSDSAKPSVVFFIEFLVAIIWSIEMLLKFVSMGLFWHPGSYFRTKKIPNIGQHSASGAKNVKRAPISHILRNFVGLVDFWGILDATSVGLAWAAVLAPWIHSHIVHNLYSHEADAMDYAILNAFEKVYSFYFGNYTAIRLLRLYKSLPALRLHPAIHVMTKAFTISLSTAVTLGGRAGTGGNMSITTIPSLRVFSIHPKKGEKGTKSAVLSTRSDYIGSSHSNVVSSRKNSSGPFQFAACIAIPIMGIILFFIALTCTQIWIGDMNSHTSIESALNTSFNGDAFVYNDYYVARSLSSMTNFGNVGSTIWVLLMSVLTGGTGYNGEGIMGTLQYVSQNSSTAVTPLETLQVYAGSADHSGRVESLDIKSVEFQFNKPNNQFAVSSPSASLFVTLMMSPGGVLFLTVFASTLSIMLAPIFATFAIGFFSYLLIFYAIPAVFYIFFAFVLSPFLTGIAAMSRAVRFIEEKETQRRLAEIDSLTVFSAMREDKIARIRANLKSDAESCKRDPSASPARRQKKSKKNKKEVKLTTTATERQRRREYLAGLSDMSVGKIAPPSSADAVRAIPDSVRRTLTVEQQLQLIITFRDFYSFPGDSVDRCQSKEQLQRQLTKLREQQERIRNNGPDVTDHHNQGSVEEIALLEKYLDYLGDYASNAEPTPADNGKSDVKLAPYFAGTSAMMSITNRLAFGKSLLPPVPVRNADQTTSDYFDAFSTKFLNAFLSSAARVSEVAKRGAAPKSGASSPSNSPRRSVSSPPRGSSNDEQPTEEPPLLITDPNGGMFIRDDVDYERKGCCFRFVAFCTNFWTVLANTLHMVIEGYPRVVSLYLTKHIAKFNKNDRRNNNHSTGTSRNDIDPYVVALRIRESTPPTMFTWVTCSIMIFNLIILATKSVSSPFLKFYNANANINNIGFDQPPTAETDMNRAANVAAFICVGLYTAEILVRFLSQGWRLYFFSPPSSDAFTPSNGSRATHGAASSSWINYVDIACIVAAYVEFALSANQSCTLSAVRAAIRLVFWGKYLPDFSGSSSTIPTRGAVVSPSRTMSFRIRHICRAFFSALPYHLSLMLMIGIVIWMWALLGAQFFNRYHMLSVNQNSFGSIPSDNGDFSFAPRNYGERLGHTQPPSTSFTFHGDDYYRYFPAAILSSSSTLQQASTNKIVSFDLEHFSTFLTSVFSVFQVFTGDDWSPLFYSTLAAIDSTDLNEDISRVNCSRVLRNSSVNFYETGFLKGVLYNVISTPSRTSLTKFTLFATAGLFFLALLLVSHFVFMPLFFGVWWYVLVGKSEQEREAILSLPPLSADKGRMFDTPAGTTEDIEELFFKRHAELERVRSAFQQDIEDSKTREDRVKLHETYGSRFKKLMDARSHPTWNYHRLSSEEEAEALQEMSGDSHTSDRVSWLLHNTDVNYATEVQAFAPANPLVSLEGPRSSHFHDGNINHKQYKHSHLLPKSGGAANELVEPTYVDPQLLAVLASTAREEHSAAIGHLGADHTNEDNYTMDDLFRYHEIYYSAEADKEYETLNESTAKATQSRLNLGSYYYAPNEENMATYYHEIQLLMAYEHATDDFPPTSQAMKEYLQEVSREEGASMVVSRNQGASKGDDSPMMIFPSTTGITHYPVLPCPPPQKIVNAYSNWKNSQGDFSETIQLPSYFSTLFRPGLTTRRTAKDLFENQHKQSVTSRQRKTQLLLLIRSFIYSRIRIASLKRAKTISDEGVAGDASSEARIKDDVNIRCQPSKFLLHLIMSQLWSFGLALGVSAEQITDSITDNSNVRSWDLLLSEIENEIAAVELQVGEEQLGRGAKSIAAAPLLRDLTTREKPLAEVSNSSTSSTSTFSRTSYSLFVFSPSSRLRQVVTVVVESIIFQVVILCVSAASLFILATYDIKHPFAASSPFFDRTNYPSISGSAASSEHFGFVTYSDAIYNNIMLHSSTRKLTLDILDNIITGIFVVEMILKVVAWGVILAPLPMGAYASLCGVRARIQLHRIVASMTKSQDNDAAVAKDPKKTQKNYITHDSSSSTSSDPSSLPTKLATVAPYLHSPWNVVDAALTIISLVTIFVVPLNLRFLKVLRFPIGLIRLLAASAYVIPQTSSTKPSNSWFMMQQENERTIHHASWVGFFDRFKRSDVIHESSPNGVSFSFWCNYLMYCFTSFFRRLLGGYTHPFYNLIFTPKFEAASEDNKDPPSIEASLRAFFCVNAPLGIFKMKSAVTTSPILPHFTSQFLSAAVVQAKVVIMSLKPLVIVCILLFINYTAWSVCSVEVWKSRMNECVDGGSDSTGLDNSAESCVARTPINSTIGANSTRVEFTITGDKNFNELPQYFGTTTTLSSTNFPTVWKSKDRNFDDFGSALHALWSVSGGGSSGNNGWWSSLMYSGPIGGSDFSNKAAWNTAAMRRRSAMASLNESSAASIALKDMLFVVDTNGTSTEFIFDETNTSLHTIANNPYLLYHEDDKDADKILNQTETGFISKLSDERSDTTLFKGIFFVAFIALTDFILLKLLIVVVLSTYYSLAFDDDVDLASIDEKDRVAATVEARWVSAAKTLCQLYRPVLANHDSLKSGQEVDGAGAGDAAPIPLSNSFSEGIGRLFFGHLEMSGRTSRSYIANGFYFAYASLGYILLVATLLIIASNQFVSFGSDGASVYGTTGANFYVYRLFSSFLLMPWCWAEMLLRWMTYGPHRCLWKSTKHTSVFPSWSSPSVGSSAPLLAGTFLPALWISLNWLELIVNALSLTDTLMKEQSSDANRNAALLFKDSHYFYTEIPFQTDRTVYLDTRESTTVFGYYYDTSLPSTAYYPSSNGLHFDFNILRSLKLVSLICIWACTFFRSEKVKPARQAIRHALRVLLKKNTALAYQSRFVFSATANAIPSLFAFTVTFATPLLICFTIIAMHSFSLITTTGGVRETYSPVAFNSNGDSSIPTNVNPYLPASAVFQSGTQEMIAAHEQLKTSDKRSYYMGGRSLENYFYHYHFESGNSTAVLLPYSRVLDEYRGFTNPYVTHATHNFASFWSSLLLVAQLSAPLSSYVFAAPIGVGATLGSGLGGVSGGGLLGASSSSFAGKVMMDLINGADPACLAGKYSTFFTYEDVDEQGSIHTYNYNCGGNGLAASAFFFFLCTFITALASGIVLGSVFVAYQRIARLHELLFFTASVTNRGSGSQVRVPKTLRHLSARQKEAVLQSFCTLWGEHVAPGDEECFVSVTNFLVILHGLPAPLGLNVQPQLCRGVSRTAALKTLQKSYNIPLYSRNGNLFVHFDAALTCVGRAILDHNMSNLSLDGSDFNRTVKSENGSVFELLRGKQPATPAHHVAASCIASVVRRHIAKTVAQERLHRRRLIDTAECVSRGLQDVPNAVDPQPFEQQFFGFHGSRVGHSEMVSKYCPHGQREAAQFISEYKVWRSNPEVFVEDVSSLNFKYESESRPPKIVLARQISATQLSLVDQNLYKTMKAYCDSYGIFLPDMDTSSSENVTEQQVGAVLEPEAPIQTPVPHPTSSQNHRDYAQNVVTQRTATRELALKKLLFNQLGDEQKQSPPLLSSLLPKSSTILTSKKSNKAKKHSPFSPREDDEDSILFARAVKKISALQLLTSKAKAEKTLNPFSRPLSATPPQSKDANSLFRAHGIYYYYNEKEPDSPKIPLESNHEKNAADVPVSADGSVETGDAAVVVVSRRNHQFTYDLHPKN